MNEQELYLEFTDTRWPFEYTDHDRSIARAIVYDKDRLFYFVRVRRWDDFGHGIFLETSGGGIDPGETPEAAVRRELKEELGAEVEITGKIGVVSDYYNLIHRHNINHYFLCKVLTFGDRSLTHQELTDFCLNTAKLSYEEAISEYEKQRSTPWGDLVSQRELPILKRAGEILL